MSTNLRHLYSRFPPQPGGLSELRGSVHSVVDVGPDPVLLLLLSGDVAIEPGLDGLRCGGVVHGLPGLDSPSLPG